MRQPAGVHSKAVGGPFADPFPGLVEVCSVFIAVSRLEAIRRNPQESTAWSRRLARY
jgi:hypothetical protein